MCIQRPYEIVSSARMIASGPERILWGNSNYGYRRGEAAPRRPGYGGAIGTGIEVGEVDGVSLAR